MIDVSYRAAYSTFLISNLGGIPFSVNKCNMEKYSNLLGLIDITFTGNVYFMTFDVAKVRGKKITWSRNTTGDGVYITITATQIATLDGNYPYSSSSSSGSYTIPSNASGPYVIWSVNVAGTTDTLETINLSIS